MWCPAVDGQLMALAPRQIEGLRRRFFALCPLQVSGSRGEEPIGFGLNPAVEVPVDEAVYGPGDGLASLRDVRGLARGCGRWRSWREGEGSEGGQGRQQAEQLQLAAAVGVGLLRAEGVGVEDQPVDPRHGRGLRCGQVRVGVHGPPVR